jgi:hypothetical protein
MRSRTKAASPSAPFAEVDGLSRHHHADCAGRADHGITCSMSRSGNVWDNAAMESFLSSLKTERTARKVQDER